MTTQKELLKKHRLGLDEEFKRKYPQGRFCIQRRSYAKPFKKTIEENEPCSFELHWVPHRNTSQRKYKGISITKAEGKHLYAGAIKNGMLHRNHQNCSFGNTRNYKSLDDLVKSAQKLGCPNDLLHAFIERYTNRAVEGFNV